MTTLLAFLDVLIVPVVVALIAIVPHTLSKFRKENTLQHADTSTALSLILTNVKSLDRKIDRVETKIDRHLGEHDGAAGRLSVPDTRKKAAKR